MAGHPIQTCIICAGRCHLKADPLNCAHYKVPRQGLIEHAAGQINKDFNFKFSHNPTDLKDGKDPPQHELIRWNVAEAKKLKQLWRSVLKSSSRSSGSYDPALNRLKATLISRDVKLLGCNQINSIQNQIKSNQFKSIQKKQIKSIQISMVFWIEALVFLTLIRRHI